MWFSQFGTLIRTCEVLVNEAEAGYFSSELEAVLHVQVKDALRKLAVEGRIAREKVSGRLLHVSADRRSRRQQLRARQARLATPGELVSFGVERAFSPMS